MSRIAVIVLFLCLTGWNAQSQSLEDKPIDQVFMTFAFVDQEAKVEALEYLKANWRPGYEIFVVDLMRLLSDPWFTESVIPVLEENSKEFFGNDYYQWLGWLWKRDLQWSPEYPYPYPPEYANFKGELYSFIDPRFAVYFKDRAGLSDVRLDEVVWGGVQQDGIPPLRYPNMIDAAEATYLADSDVVFGIEIEGDIRAYPKRILAWHEMFVDQVGGQMVAGVYCTLCGTVIAYDMRHDGVVHGLGTSGFLFRSNKLMYDGATQSLWSTIEGVPVVGPLSGDTIELATFPVVTTTWGEWRKRHPESRVLDVATGHDRDYGEGVAYKDYFATDRLMFPVPLEDSRLNNKDEVMIIRSPGYKNDPLAISVKYLMKKRLYNGKIAGQSFVVVTDKEGAARAYSTGNVVFEKMDSGLLLDSEGRSWTMEETQLANPNLDPLPRLPSHNIFWFAWYNAYPNTRLVK